MAQDDGRQGHAVEGVGLDHGVQRHVLQDDLAALCQGVVEGVVPDDVPGQAGGSCQAVGVGLLPRLAGILHRRTVRHLQHVGHVAGGGGVQNGNIHAVVDYLQHGGDQKARV